MSFLLIKKYLSPRLSETTLCASIAANLAGEECIERFPLSSEQCELLVAFSESLSLTELSQKLGRENSVVSRQLQKVAETENVLEKVRGKWQLTDLGHHLVNWTRGALFSQKKVIQQSQSLKNLGNRVSTDQPSALLLIGLQQGFQSSDWGPRNNLDAERRIQSLLGLWRERTWPIFHIPHLSTEISSPLRKGSAGAEFLSELKPLPNEVVIEKSGNSAFSRTELYEGLQKSKVSTVVLAGFTLNHCVDASARNASDLGLQVYVVEDACVTFDRIGPDGQRVRADDIARSTLANLNQEFATAISSQNF